MHSFHKQRTGYIFIVGSLKTVKELVRLCIGPVYTALNDRTKTSVRRWVETPKLRLKLYCKITNQDVEIKHDFVTAVQHCANIL